MCAWLCRPEVIQESHKKRIPVATGLTPPQRWAGIPSSFHTHLVPSLTPGASIARRLAFATHSLMYISWLDPILITAALLIAQLDCFPVLIHSWCDTVSRADFLFPMQLEVPIEKTLILDLCVQLSISASVLQSLLCQPNPSQWTQWGSSGQGTCHRDSYLYP